MKSIITIVSIIFLIVIATFLTTACETTSEEPRPIETQSYASGNTSIALIAEQYPVDIYMIVSTSGLTERVCFLAINYADAHVAPSISCR
jgi:hypothetical protein